MPEETQTPAAAAPATPVGPAPLPESVQRELEELTNIQRAAVLMLLLGEQQAADIIKYLNPKEVQSLGAAMTQVADLSQEAVNAVLDDFIATIKKQTSLGLGSSDYVENVLKRALGEDKAASVLSRIMPGASSKGLDILRWMDARSIADMDPEKLIAAVKQRKGWMGLAHDGDADRMVLIDEEGERVDGDEVIAMAALDAMERGALKGKTVVVTQMSNLGLDEAVKARGGSVVRTAVGDRHVAEAMRKGGFVVGGEQSGHLLFHDAAPTGDGLLSALKIFSSMMRKKVGLAELRKGMKRYPQKLLNLRVRHKPAWETVAPLAQAVREMEQVLGKRGRILLRYSGTENLVRLLVEADKMDTIDRVVDRLMPILQEHLGEK